MKERPILFSAPMVRAILEGRKTMTRRVVKPIKDHGGLGRNMGSPIEYECNWISETLCSGYFDFQHKSYGKTRHETIHCPYGQPGDRLWVRETFSRHPQFADIAYRADGNEFEDSDGFTWIPKWKPSIFMPRKLSRITLEITNVRVERLNDISEEDAECEGISSSFGNWKNYTDQSVVCQTSKASFRTLWESINGPGSWDANPWVWVVEFKRSDNG